MVITHTALTMQCYYAELTGSSLVTDHVEMMGLMGIGNNLGVGCTVAIE